MITINCTYAKHKNQEIILLHCPINSEINKIFRATKFIVYSNSLKSWYIPKNKIILTETINTVKPIATVNIDGLLQSKAEISQAVINKTKIFSINIISIHNQHQLEKYIKILVLKGYSENTIHTYKNEFSIFLQTLKNVKAETFTRQRIIDYLAYCYNILKLKENTLHSRMNALKFYYEQVLNNEKIFWEIPRPKKQLILPKVISEEKIINSICKVKNLKHRTLLLLTYSAGLRVSEVVNLRVNNIDSNRMQIFVENAKGKKDRVVTLSNAILILLREYYVVYKPNIWLFEGQHKGMPYSARSAQIIFKEAIKNLNLPSNCSFHSLRHSYATHLLDNGTDIKYIQQLLGHNDIKTTLRYLHVSTKDINKIESPLDKLMQKQLNKQK